MGSINLAGRIPRIVSPLSPRLIVLGAALFVLAIGVVVYGFKYRFKQQQDRKEHQQSQTVASDAATSNRLTVHGEVPPSSLTEDPTAAPTGSGGGVTAPLVGAAKTVANPFPKPEQYGPYTPPYMGVTAAQVDPIEELRRRRLAHEYERAQQADEAPTGATKVDGSSNPAIQSASSDLEAAQKQVLQDLRAVNNDAALGIPATSASRVSPGAGTVSAPTDEDEQNYGGQNEQGDKRRFNQGGEGPGDDYLKTTRTPALSPWEIQRGTIIPAILSHKMVSDLPGDLTASVARDVYDSATQTYVLIPAGSRLVGEYNSNVSYAQGRAQVVWIAIYFPDGSHIDLDRMPSHSADGSVGLSDQVDNHYKRLIGGVVLSSILAAGLQISQNRGNSGSVLSYPSTGQVAASAIGSQMGQLGQQITSRNLNIQPTIKLREGDPFSVSVKKDIVFAGPYESLAKENQ